MHRPQGAGLLRALEEQQEGLYTGRDRSEWAPVEMLRSGKGMGLTRRVMKTTVKMLVFILTQARKARGAKEQSVQVSILEESLSWLCGDSTVPYFNYKIEFKL